MSSSKSSSYELWIMRGANSADGINGSASFLLCADCQTEFSERSSDLRGGCGACNNLVGIDLFLMPDREVPGVLLALKDLDIPRGEGVTAR